MKRLRRRAPVVSVLLLLVMLLTSALAVGCGADQETPPTATISVTDDLGKLIELDEPAERIISLAPSNTEIVFAIGAGDQLVGRTDYCNFPPEVSSVESIGGFYSPNIDAVVLLEPDIVIATGLHDQIGITTQLEDLGLTVVTLAPENLDGIMDNISMVGELTGNEAEADQLVADMQSTIDYISDRTAGLSAEERPTVLHVTWHDPLWTAGAETFINELIDIAGGVNIFSDVIGDVQVDVDTAVIRNPQVITVVTSHGSAMHMSYDYIAAPGSPFSTTDAYIDGKVYEINADLACRPGPRIVETLELLAGFLHPEIFP